MNGKFAPRMLGASLAILSSIGSGGAVLFAQSSTPGTFRPVGPMTATRYSHTATRLANLHVLAAGGFGTCDVSAGNACASAELYNPATGKWTATETMTTPRANHTATLLATGKVLAAGGFTASAELYDPATGKWTATGSMKTSRWSHAATMLPNGKVLVSGGIDPSGSSTASAEIYDPATGVWTATGQMIKPRASHVLTQLPTGLVLATGDAGRTSEVYNPATGTWSLTGPMGAARATHTVSLMLTGKVLAAGGSDAGSLGQFNSAEVFDPLTGKWSPTGSMATPRGSHVASLLANGKVMVVGGISTCELESGCNTTAGAELYDPATGQWTATGSLIPGAAFQTATFLPGSRILVTGGLNLQGIESVELSSTALYIP